MRGLLATKHPDGSAPRSAHRESPRSSRWRRRASQISIAAAAGLLALSGTAHAHTIGVSSGRYQLEGTAVIAHLSFAGTELFAVLPRAIAGHGSWVAMLAEPERLGRWLIERIEVHDEQHVCAALPATVRLDGDGVVFDLRFACSPTVHRVTVASHFLAELGATHAQLLQVTGAAGTQEQVLRASDPPFAFDRDGLFVPSEQAKVLGGSAEAQATAPGRAKVQWAIAFALALVACALGARGWGRSNRRPPQTP